MSLQFIITNAGKAAIVNAQNTGTAPVTIASVGFGSTSWTPTATATSLQSEVKRITAIGGDVVNGDTIHVTVQDATTDSYVIREIGVFLTDGTLLAIASDPAEILDKRPAISVNLSVDIVVTNLPAGSVTVGGISISNPPASNTIAGAIMTANGTETADGLSQTKAVTPFSLLSRTATMIRAGLVRLATGSETSDGTSDSLAVTPLGLLSRTASTIRSGLTRLATSAETIAGSLDSVAVTPAGLASLTSNFSRRGLVQLANSSEMSAMTNLDKAVTPGMIGASPIVPKAFVVFNGTGVVQILSGSSYNVSSITDRGVGRYTVNFGTSIGGNYCYFACARDENDTGNTMTVGPYLSDAKTDLSLAINTTVATTLTDSPEVCVLVFSR